jgi:hypothetical protein
LFKDTLFLSDGFHWPNHTNCAHSFNSSEYEELLENIPSVLHEIKNKTLAKLKITTPFMKYDTFVETLTAILAVMNYKETLRA